MDPLRKRGSSNPRGTWGSYMDAKKSKLSIQGDEVKNGLPCPTPIFSGLSIHTNGCVSPTNEELRQLILRNGGKHDHYFSKKSTTHVVAENLASCKIDDFENVKVVRPDWILDSVREGILLPWKDFSLYDNDKNFTPTPFETGVIETQSEWHDDENGYDEIEDLDTVESLENVSVSRDDPSKNLKAGDPGFLETFFSKSRLHHLSTAGNEFKRYVEEKRIQARKESTFVLSGVEKLKAYLRQLDSPDVFDPEKDPYLMHIDMDCFFVSVGLRSRPGLKDSPVAVTHAKSGKGQQNQQTSSEETSEFKSYAEVASCNYEARKFGIRNGMLLGSAFQKCPHLKVIPYDFEGYASVSRSLYDLILSFTLQVEAVSCDEMYVDLKNVLSDVNCSPSDFATFIREEVKRLTDCDASVGIGPNVLVAKMASKRAKPNGQLVVPQTSVREFMSREKVRDLPGIGRSLEEKLAETFNVETCTDLIKVPHDRLKQVFGQKMGENLYHLCRGMDRKDLKFEQGTNRKSVSVEVNYGIRFQDFESLEKFLIELSEEVVKRLKLINSRGRSITIKLKVKSKDAPESTPKFLGHGLCDNMSRSTILPTLTDSPEVISKCVIKLVKSFNLFVPHLRGIGIQITKLGLCTLRDTSNHPSIQDFFGGTNRATASTSSSSAFGVASSLPEIDEEVLKELPADIRNEVTASLTNTSSTSLSKKTKSMKCSKERSSNRVGKSSRGPMDRLLDQMRHPESSLSGRNVSHIMSLRNKFCGLDDIDEISVILREWIVTEESPQDEDVAYITRFLLSLVEAQELDKIARMMNILYDEVLTRDKDWLDVYQTLVGIVRFEVEELPEEKSSEILSILSFFQEEAYNQSKTNE